MLAGEHQVHSLFHSTPYQNPDCDFTIADIRNEYALAVLFKKFRPELVIHLAGITAVSHALAITEEDVRAINVTASGTLARLAGEYSAKIIYTSTDLVYSGDEGGLVKEEGKLNPLSLYASTKLEGERAVIDNTEDFLILRVALMYGFSKGKLKAFFQEAYNKVKSGQEVVLFHDQFRSSLSIIDGARMLSDLVNKEIEEKFLNFGAPERTSRADLFSRFAKKAGLDGRFLVFKSLDDFPNLPRVVDVSLDISRLLSLGITPLPVDDSIDEIVKELP